MTNFEMTDRRRRPKVVPRAAADFVRQLKSDIFAHFESLLNILRTLISQPSHPDTSYMSSSELQKVLQRFQTFLEPQVSLINTHFLIKKSNIFSHFESLLHVLRTLISQPGHPETCYMSSSELQEVSKRFQTLLESLVDI